MTLVTTPWHLINNLSEAEHAQLKSDGVVPYPEPIYQSLTFDEQNNLVYVQENESTKSPWDIEQFIQSANQWKVDDNQLPVSLLLYLINRATLELCQILIQQYNRPVLARFVMIAMTQHDILYFPPTNFDKLLETCAGNGLFTFLKHLDTVEKPPNYNPTSRPMIAAAERGDLPCIQYLHHAGYPWSDQYTHNVSMVSCILAMRGHLACLTYAVENGCPIDSVSCAGATEEGEIDCLRYLHEQGGFMCELTCKNAVCHGHIDCLEYIIKHTQPKDFMTVFTTDTSATAAWYGQLASLKMLHEAGCPWDENTPSNAAYRGYLECLRYAFEQGCPWDEHTASSAARNGHLECLKYALTNQCPATISTCNLAAEFGSLASLIYAHEHGCPWDADTMARAAWHGRLNYIQYMHENGCPWDESACALAADAGAYECLVYLHENGCPWDHRTGVNAKMSCNRNSDKCLTYANKHGLGSFRHQLTDYVCCKYNNAVSDLGFSYGSRLRYYFWGFLYFIMLRISFICDDRA
jgi:hypothetical protein